MWIDPIVEDVRQGREAYAAQFDYDIQAICHDIREQERLSGRKVVRLTPKRPQEAVEGKSTLLDQGVGQGR